ncbi:MAG: hypothetical protein JO331_03035 [Verrucomicrobia bacterium]|nr:hypothetical protein [Verrucomicrobiota bacterium]
MPSPPAHLPHCREGYLLFSMSTSLSEMEQFVENWLTDVQRRGAELYSSNRVDQTLYLSFEGKEMQRFAVQIDFLATDVKVEITRPGFSYIERRQFLLSSTNLTRFAKRMCWVQAGQAAVPVYLLAQLSIICHAYRRLLQDYDREHGFQTSTGTIEQIEDDLSRYLTPEERRRTDNPILRNREYKRETEVPEDK